MKKFLVRGPCQFGRFTHNVQTTMQVEDVANSKAAIHVAASA